MSLQEEMITPDYDAPAPQLPAENPATNPEPNFVQSSSELSAPTAAVTPVEPLSPAGILILCCVFFGVAITEACSVFVLPLTLKLFTDNPEHIFLILAINPAFGFIAQPLVGVWSDRIWTRFGRRGFFLVTCAPLVALSLIMIPYVTSLPVMVAVVIWLQFFQDVLNGTDQPLIADIVPPEQRTFIMGLIGTVSNIATMCVLYVGMSWVTSYKATHGDEQFGLPLYWAAAVAQVLFVTGAALFIKGLETERLPSKRPTLTPSRYIQDFLAQPMLARIAAAYFMRAFTKTAIQGSIALYASQTLGFSAQQIGQSWGVTPFLALASSIPLGVFVERFAKPTVLQLGFAGIIVSCFVGYSATSPTGLAMAAVCFGVGDTTLEVTHKAFMTEQFDPDKVGQLSGCVNIFYAVGRTFALVLVGVAIDLTQSEDELATPDYHVIWIISAVGATIGIAIMSTVTDHRHEQRLASAALAPV
jgi:Na+/melibiose symporter-like transporter